MNNKGFTIVELVATIALLSVIMVISFVSITAIVDAGKINECKALVSNIKSATKEYFSDNRYNIEQLKAYAVNGNDKEYIIGVSLLINEKYLTNNVINPFDNEIEMDDNDIKINVNLKDNYMVEKIIIKNSGNNLVNCDNKEW